MEAALEKALDWASYSFGWFDRRTWSKLHSVQHLFHHKLLTGPFACDSLHSGSYRSGDAHFLGAHSIDNYSSL